MKLLYSEYIRDCLTSWNWECTLSNHTILIWCILSASKLCHHQLSFETVLSLYRQWVQINSIFYCNKLIVSPLIPDQNIHTSSLQWKRSTHEAALLISRAVRASFTKEYGLKKGSEFSSNPAEETETHIIMSWVCGLQWERESEWERDTEPPFLSYCFCILSSCSSVEQKARSLNGLKQAPCRSLNRSLCQDE